ncbi:hypothetical protein Aperf_G00000088105 [Anoplocephala perfoliata]
MTTLSVICFSFNSGFGSHPQLFLLLIFAISKPRTHKGRKFLADREPKIFENDKHTLVFKGAHTSDLVNSFLTDLCSLKNPLARKLQRKNRVLPFEDASFINLKLSLGAKPVLVFSGEAFDENEETQLLKSILIDLFRGPKVSKVNTSGLEFIIHFIMPSPERLFMRVQTINLNSLKKPDDEHSGDEKKEPIEPLQTPWGSYVNLELGEAAPQVDFVVRRHQLPSQDKWKRALRVPAEIRQKKDKATKNRSMDIYGSRVAQIHLQRETALNEMRPGSSLRTALTGHVKQGFERQRKPKFNAKGIKKRKLDGDSEEVRSTKRLKAE